MMVDVIDWWEFSVKIVLGVEDGGAVELAAFSTMASIGKKSFSVIYC